MGGGEDAEFVCEERAGAGASAPGEIIEGSVGEDKAQLPASCFVPAPGARQSLICFIWLARLFHMARSFPFRGVWRRELNARLFEEARAQCCLQLVQCSLEVVLCRTHRLSGDLSRLRE